MHNTVEPDASSDHVPAVLGWTLHVIRHPILPHDELTWVERLGIESRYDIRIVRIVRKSNRHGPGGIAADERAKTGGRWDWSTAKCVMEQRHEGRAQLVEGRKIFAYANIVASRAYVYELSCQRGAL
jgi:hypothetical protein